MISRDISKFNLLEILILPLIFIMIFTSGAILFVSMGIINYSVYAGWCFGTGAIVGGVVLYYSYRSLNRDPKQLIDNRYLYENGGVHLRDVDQPMQTMYPEQHISENNTEKTIRTHRKKKKSP
jgi:hypothetical protein